MYSNQRETSARTRTHRTFGANTRCSTLFSCLSKAARLALRLSSANATSWKPLRAAIISAAANDSRCRTSTPQACAATFVGHIDVRAGLSKHGHAGCACGVRSDDECRAAVLVDAVDVQQRLRLLLICIRIHFAVTRRARLVKEQLQRGRVRVVAVMCKICCSRFAHVRGAVKRSEGMLVLSLPRHILGQQRRHAGHMTVQAGIVQWRVTWSGSLMPMQSDGRTQFVDAIDGEVLAQVTQHVFNAPRRRQMRRRQSVAVTAPT